MTLLSCFLPSPVVPRGGGLLRTAMPHIMPATSTSRSPVTISERFLHRRLLRTSTSHPFSIPTRTNITSSLSDSQTTAAATTAMAQDTKQPYAPGHKDKLLPLPDSLKSDTDMAPRYDPQAIEQDLYAWWEASGLFRPCAPNGREPFVICMPPPNVTGVLHMGHAMFATLQDILTRFHRMRGRPTLWLPGTDHAGIATQLVVEKQLASDGLPGRLDLGRDEFLNVVWKWKQEKGGYITQQIRRLGSSCDWQREKFTLDSNMSASVVEAFKRLHDEGLIYKGTYMVNWSPNLGTAVSDLEVEFSQESGKLYYFKYLLSGTDNSDEFLPVATTRPETILGDTAVCVHPEDERYRHFIGKKVKVPLMDREIPIIADEYVDREFGTGALKITPGHDHNDYELGKKHNLETINIMNRDGTINENGGMFDGMDRFDARKQLWKTMEEQALTIKVEDYMNRVPRSQRGGEIIEPLISTQWFIKMDGLAKDALDAVRDKKVTIVPQRFEKVYFNWLEDIRDWCISRQLWWGHRIPVWYINDNEDDFVVASNEQEAYELAKQKYKGKKDIRLTQETDVLDTWFSSGLWPFSTMGWPNENTQDMQTFFPGSVMETGYDILFFWVARMIMLSLRLTGKVPFETVYLHGLVRDKEGRKMSKSLGNVIDPIDTINEYGTDALRYTLVTGSTPGQDIPLSNEKVEANRNFANKLWNASRFIIGNLNGISEEEKMYLAKIVNTGLETKTSEDTLPLPERFIVSKLHSLVASVGSGLEMLSFGDAGRLIQEFLWDEFADWYVEIAKTRLFGDDEDAKKQTRATLVYVMDTCLRLLHPFMPFVTEAIWHRFPRNGSPEKALITAAWPAGGVIDQECIRRFERLQALVGRIRNARAEYQVESTNRIPLTIRADPVSAADIEAEKGMLFLLTKVDPEQFAVEIQKMGSDDQQSQSEQTGNEDDDGDQALRLIVADGIEAIIPMRSMIDFDKERKRLEKQMTKVQKDLEGLNKRLNSPGFANKAPPAVVNQTKSSADELAVQLSSLTKRLENVEKMASTE